MSTEAKSLMEVVEKSYQFWVYLFTIFVVCMGVARWHGTQVWRKHEESRRSDNGLLSFPGAVRIRASPTQACSRAA